MLDVLKDYLKGLNKREILVLLLFAIFFIIFIFISLINAIFGGNKNTKQANDLSNINSSNIVNYISNDTNLFDNSTEKSTLVTDYTTFFSVQDALQNFIRYIMDEDYENTYKVLNVSLQNKYDKKSYLEKIKKFTEYNFLNADPNLPINKDEEIDFINYANVNNLLKLYKLNDYDNCYLCDVININKDVIKIGIELNTINKTYNVFYLELGEE